MEYQRGIKIIHLSLVHWFQFLGLVFYLFKGNVCFAICEQSEIGIYLYTLLVCLFVWLYSINVKTAKLIGSNFLWDLMWSQGRFMDDRIFKSLPLTKFDFWRFWKSTKKFLFVFVLQCVQSENVTIKMENGREAPCKPSVLKNTYKK